eukprot:Rmarinus@m.1259
MRFGAKLESQAVVDWKNSYLDYRSLKKRIKRLRDKSVNDSDSETGLLLSPSLVEENDFESHFEDEFTKVTGFYFLKVEAFQQQWAYLKEHLVPLMETTVRPSGRSAEALKETTRRLYREAAYLRNYQNLNYVGMVKIWKKYDKLLGCDKQDEQVQKINADPFCTSTAVQDLLGQIEDVYASVFCGDNLHEAKLELLEKLGPTRDWTLFETGMRAGVVLTLFVWAIWDCVVDTRMRNNESPKTQYVWNSLPVYLAVASLLVLVWFWAWCLYVWNVARINFHYLFDITEKDWMSTHEKTLDEAVTMTTVFLVNFIVFYKVARGDFPEWIPMEAFPVSVFVFALLWMVFPLRERHGFYTLLWNVVNPRGQLTFREWYAADVLTSMVKPLTSMVYSLCFFFSGEFLNRVTDDMTDSPYCSSDVVWYGGVLIPIVSALPLMWRLLQCLRRYLETGKRMPFIANAFKYAFAHTCIIFGIFHSSLKDNIRGFDVYKLLYVMLLAMSTLYTFAWDIKMDWGLLEPGSPWPFLRRRLMFRRVWVYYVAMVADFFLRFLWTLTLVPAAGHPLLSGFVQRYLDPFLMVIEIFRRSMWGCFRLEYEHISNSLEFRHLDFVPLRFETSTRVRTEEKKVLGTAVIVEVLVVILVVLSLAVLAGLTA